MSKEVIFTIPAGMCGSCAAGVKETIQRIVIKKLHPEFSNIVLDPMFNDEQEKIDDIVNPIVIIDCYYGTKDKQKKADEKKKKVICHLVFISDNPTEIGPILAALKAAGFQAGEEQDRFWDVVLPVVLSFGAALLIAILPLSPLALTIGGLLASFYLGQDIYRRAWSGEPMDILFSLSIFLTFVALFVGLCVPGLAGCSVMPFMPLVIIGFQHLGNASREYTQPPETQLDLLSQIRPSYSVSEIDKRPIGSLKKGDIITLYPGSTIPVDVICFEDCEVSASTSDGQAHITHSILKSTGTVKNSIKQGTELAGDKPVTFTVERIYRDSELSCIQKKVEQLQKPEDSLSIKIKMRYFLIALLCVAAAMGCFTYFHLVFSDVGWSGLFSHFYFYSFGKALNTGIGVLLSLCPCSWGLVSGLSTLVMQDAMIKNGIDLSHVRVPQQNPKHVVFDLNGTLTKAQPIINKILSRDGFNEQELKNIIYTLEEGDPHPFAKEIYSFLQYKRVTSYSDAVTDKKREHCAIEKTIDGRRYRISSALHSEQKEMKDSEGKTFSYVEEMTLMSGAAEKKEYQYRVIGIVELELVWRDNAFDVIDALTRKGKTVHICTGATSVCLPEAIRKKVQLKEGCDPQQKLDYILSLKKEGVLMVGDAGNDVLPLAASDIGITIKHEAYDVAAGAVSNCHIKPEDLKKLPFIVETLEYCADRARLFKTLSYGLIASITILLMLPMPITGLGYILPSWVSSSGMSMYMPAIIGAAFSLCFRKGAVDISPLTNQNSLTGIAKKISPGDPGRALTVQHDMRQTFSGPASAELVTANSATACPDVSETLRRDQCSVGISPTPC